MKAAPAVLGRFTGWWQWRKRAACPHPHLRPVFGDEIIRGTPNWNRLQCLICGRFLDGPVSFALVRVGN